MTVESISAENFAGLQKFSVNLNPRITYLCGPNGAGKSTIAKTAFFFGLEGIAEKGTHYKGRGSFVGQWGDEAKTTIILRDDKGTYTVTRAMNDQKQTQFSVVADDGRALDQKWLDGLFKSLMISPMDFAMLKPKEQAMELGIDTSQFDEKILEKKQDAKGLRAIINDFGEIVIPPPCERVDISELNRQKNEAVKFNQEQEEKRMAFCLSKDRMESKCMEIKDLEQKLSKARLEYDAICDTINTIPKPEPLKDTTAFDKVMEELDKQNQEAALYEQAVKKAEEKMIREAMLERNLREQKALQEQKTAYLQSLDLPFATMTIDDDGGLLMDGLPLCEPYKSSGELWAIIPRIIAKLNPSLRYLFIQGWNLMDKKKQANLVNDLLELGFQLCIEVVDETEDGGIIVLTELDS